MTSSDCSQNANSSVPLDVAGHRFRPFDAMTSSSMDRIVSINGARSRPFDDIIGFWPECESRLTWQDIVVLPFDAMTSSSMDRIVVSKNYHQEVVFIVRFQIGVPVSLLA
jgi:hypothetical protein